MKWFDKWFYAKTRWCWIRAEQEYPEWKKYQDFLDEAAEPKDAVETLVKGSDSIALSHDDGSEHDLYDGIRIFVKRLNGGYVVTFRHPVDHSNHQYTDERRQNSYIVTEDEDFGDRLVKLLTMELLKR